ncbi:ATP-binding protein [Spirochaeta dissipatitropha]
MQKINPGTSFYVFGISITVTLLLLALIMTSRPEIAVESPGLDIKMHISESNLRRLSLDIRQVDRNYRIFDQKEVSSSARFVYLWLNISNTSPLDRTIYFVNDGRNYYTELLRPAAGGGVTVYRHGDIVASSDYVIKDTRAAFPITIPAGSSVERVVEYHGPRSILVKPQIWEPGAYMNRMLRHRGVLGGVSGAVLVLILINLTAGWIYRSLTYLASAAFSFSVYFFFLRQSRLLLLYFDNLIYPEYLFPLSIFLNLLTAGFLVYVLFRKYMTTFIRLSFSFLLGFGLLFSSLAFWMLPYFFADMLNLLALPFLLLVVLLAYYAMKDRDVEVLWISFTAIPWISMMFLDIISSVYGLRSSGLVQYRQILGLTAFVLMLSLLLQYIGYRRNRDIAENAADETEKIRAEYSIQSASLGNLQTAILKEISHQLHLPLESIIASARILGRSFNDPKVIAASQVIRNEAESLIHHVNEVIHCANIDDSPDPPVVSEEISLNDSNGAALAGSLSSGSIGSVMILDENAMNAKHSALVLQAEGMQTIIASDHYHVLQAASKGEFDVLLVDSSSIGEQAFQLCSMLRSEFNLLQLPVLMVTDYFADYIIRQGFAVGVNDFLVRPFDVSELTLRMQSLVKLKKVVEHNHDLARSESEKNAFLFFLTHNINTPLTILLNRIRDLNDLVTLDNLSEIVEDLLSSSREINDVVQNVLISFRLADGRHTLRLEELDLVELVEAVTRDLHGKISAKNQVLKLDIPFAEVPVYGDFVSLRGIIYNLVDNACKFSPLGSVVDVVVSKDRNIRLEVRDQGPGISEADQLRLFQRFEKLSARPSGGESSTGLGLYVAYELARLNDGNLSYSTSFPGACFILDLKAVQRNQGE